MKHVINNAIYENYMTANVQDKMFLIREALSNVIISSC